LSIGGRVILLNVAISAIPLYWMSIYRLSIKVKSDINKITKRFLWYGKLEKDFQLRKMVV
jgi:hypothetical protein